MTPLSCRQRPARIQLSSTIAENTRRRFAIAELGQFCYGKAARIVSRLEVPMIGDRRTRTIWLLGDPEDPWVGLLRASLSSVAAVRFVPTGGAVPVRPFDLDDPPELLILHRSRLTQADVARLDEWIPSTRPNSRFPIILCYSPYVRYAELERAAARVELAIPEATAVETLP